MRLEQVRAERNKAQGTRHADQLGTSGLREDTFNKAIHVAAVAQLSRKTRGWSLLQLGLQLWRDGLLIVNWWQTSGLTVTKSIFALLVIHIRQHAHCRVKGGFNLDDGGLQTTRSHATRDIDFYLDHVTRNDDGRASWGTGQDNIAGLQGHVLRQVCNKLRQREDQIFIGGAVFLHNVAIDPGAQAQGLGVDTLGIDKLWPNRGVAIARLGTGIRALILRPVVV